MSGFITVERKIWKNPVFSDAEMTEREAFIWMVSNAAWSETTHLVGSELFPVQRGSFMETLRGLQSVFMWKSDKRVRGYLKKLEKYGILSVDMVSSGRQKRRT